MEAFREPLPERKLWEKALPWVAALVLAAGVIAAIVRFFPSSSGTTDISPSAGFHPKIVSSKAPPSVPLSASARQVAGRFILTAVQRKHLDEAWKLSGPLIRQDLTYKQFLTGNIAVVPFLLPLKLTPMKVDFSYSDRALLEVALVPKGKQHAAYFYLELRRIGEGAGAHWVVWTWVPNSPPPIPANPVGG
jgi:hypothetical protein